MSEGPAELKDPGRPDLTRRFCRIASERLAGKRLDQYLIHSGLGVSRTRAAQLITDGKVQVNGRPSKPSYRVRRGDEISATFEPEPELTIAPQKMDLAIVYEDNAVLVLDKPAGVVVHPARGNRDRTLVNALLYHCKSLPLRTDSLARPGVVHRLDKETTGLLMFAKSDQALRGLGYQVEHRTVVREYACFAWGEFEADEGTVDAPIGRHAIDRTRMAVTPFAARTAVTNYEVFRRYGVCTYLRVRLKTGRTHQIRVHMQHIGHPVVGDPEYGGRSSAVVTRREHMPWYKEMLGIMRRQALHAARLGFNHPLTQKYMEFSSPLPKDMERLLLYLEENTRRTARREPRPDSATL
ncbi:RluA family pseudouridine synthase, partial [candidate division WOR-3 bacterium]|nr:RluA family pseudouridine synthase [candidate division WOR-3 bacterium]